MSLRRFQSRAGALGGDRVLRGGFTLIELLVALALAAILSVMIMMIASTAQETYLATVERVEIYNRFRLALDTLRQDFSNWIPSQELEFYVDGRGPSARRNFHYDPGEEVPDPPGQPGQINGGTPVYDEFAYIVEAHYESVEPSQIAQGEFEPRLHDAYQAYFRTMTFVDGRTREANVEYMLVDPSRPKEEWQNDVPPPPRRVQPDDVPNLALYKIVRYQDIDPDAILKIHEYNVVRRVIEVATNVTDFRIEYVVSNPFARNRPQNTVRFTTPEGEFAPGRFAERATAPERVEDPKLGMVYRKAFGYGSVKIGEKFDLALAEPAVRADQGLRAATKPPQPVRMGFRGNPNISFAELVPGDEVYVFRDTLSDMRGGGAATSAFPAATYTVKANLNGMLEFIEDIDSSTWGEQDQNGIRYKAAFVPQAVRITVRMVDGKGLNPKTMQQVFWTHRRSR